MSACCTVPCGPKCPVLPPCDCLCRLMELHAAGNSLTELPAQLGAFTSLSRLDLSWNKLHGLAVCALGQLPVLRLLNVSHNLISLFPEGLAGTSELSGTAAGGSSWGTGACQVFQSLVELDLSHNKVAAAAGLQPLLQLSQLQVLQLAETPLARSCLHDDSPIKVRPGSRPAHDCQQASDSLPEVSPAVNPAVKHSGQHSAQPSDEHRHVVRVVQELYKPGLQILLDAIPAHKLWQHYSKEAQAKTAQAEAAVLATAACCTWLWCSAAACQC